MRKFVLALLSAAFLGGCSDGAGPESSSSVSIKFGIAGTTASPSSMASFSVAGGAADDGSLHVTGSNGNLDITAVWLIVDEFELEPVEHHCDDGLGGDEHCPKFEQRFFFINLPLNGEFTTVVTEEIPPGNYDELEFEVDNVHVHDDDSDEDAALILALFAEIVDAGFVDGMLGEWPEDASLVVIGSFDDGSGPIGFTTFFEAEIEIEVEFDEDDPLVITGVDDPDIIVQVMLDRWFKRGDGTVWNLAELEGELVEFEVEIEDGFEVKIEIDDDDDD